MKRTLIAVTLLAGLPGFTIAQGDGTLDTAPPPAPYAPVAELVPLPEFIPGLGRLFVDPETLPAGPFLGYDREGRLAGTVYMIPLEAIGAGSDGYADLAAGGRDVTAVDVHYNPGHLGVEMPHAHVVLWHAEDAKARVSQ